MNMKRQQVNEFALSTGRGIEVMFKGNRNTHGLKERVRGKKKSNQWIFKESKITG